jgi:predicted metal-dependent enzyme (double-stranded beta helix superfamily)
MFDLDRFVEDCKQAVAEDPSHRSVKGLVERAVSDPNGLMNAIGEPVKAGVTKLYHGPELTILNLVWGKHMTVMPHNHEMWAMIGIYSGRENNIFWRKLPEDAKTEIEAAGAKSLGAGDAAPLGADIIHSVTNPLGRFTGAIHVYGGDFFEVERSEWDPEDLTEKPYDVAKNVGMFEDANRT